MPTPKKGPRLASSPAHERLMLANMATSLFQNGRITTTEPVAKKAVVKEAEAAAKVAEEEAPAVEAEATEAAEAVEAPVEETAAAEAEAPAEEAADAEKAE